MHIYNEFKKILRYIICVFLVNLLYNIFCSIFTKDRICFIVCQESSKYMNINIVYELIKKDIRCTIIEDKFLLKNIFQIAKSRIVVLDQSSKILKDIKLQNGTTCIQLWHSSGWYKKVGYDALRDGYDKNSEIRRVNRLHGYIDYFIISDRKLVPFYAKAFHLPEKHILPLGLVRTDRYYSIDVNSNKTTIQQAYPKTKDKKILLYAPTFRQNHLKKKRDSVQLLDIDALHGALGNEWCFALREHPSTVSDETPGWMNFSRLDQDLCLSVADILITDYSSILFDYAFFRRPILLYISDINEYIESQRKIYVSPEDLVGSRCVCSTTEDIIKSISQNTFLDHKIWERFMEDCDGHSSERVVNFLRNTFLKHPHAGGES